MHSLGAWKRLRLISPSLLVKKYWPGALLGLHMGLSIALIFVSCVALIDKSASPLRSLERANRLIEVTETSHGFAQAAVIWANERGITYVAIRSGLAGYRQRRNAIADARRSSDIEFNWVLSGLDCEMPLDDRNTELRCAIKDGYKAICRKRTIMDVNLHSLEQKGGKENPEGSEDPTEDWFQDCVTIIDSAIELSGNIGNSEECSEDDIPCATLKLTQRLSQLVAKTAESAGEERARIAGALHNKEHLPTGKWRNLRRQVTEPWASIKRTLSSTEGAQPSEAILKAFFEADAAVFAESGEFEDYRRRTNDALSKGAAYKGCITADTWYKKATRAIESLTELGLQVKLEADESIQELIAEKQKIYVHYRWSCIVTVVILLLLAIGNIWCQWRRGKVAWDIYKCHRIAALLFKAAKQMAEERGRTYWWWSNESTKIKDTSWLKDIVKPQWNGSGHLAEVFMALGKGIGINGEEQFLGKVAAAYIRLQKKRRGLWDHVKSDESGATGNVVMRDEWFEECNAYLGTLSQLHLAIVHHAATIDDEDFDSPISNLTVRRHYLWEMGDYVGRERAVIAGALASSYSGEDKTRREELLDDYRTKAEEALWTTQLILCDECQKKENCRPARANEMDKAGIIVGCRGGEWVKDIKNINDAAFDIVTAESTFRDLRQKARKQVKAPETSDGAPGIQPEEWFDDATKAMQPIFECAEKITEYVHRESKKSVVLVGIWLSLSFVLPVVGVSIMVVAIFGWFS